MHGVSTAQQLRGHRDRPLPRVRVVFGEVVAEVGAVDVLHDEEQLLASLPASCTVTRPGWSDLCGHTALAHEAAAQFVATWTDTLSGRSSFTANA
ncbi:hypothetical protein GCM10023238_31010 [Streptomyces heliomycini]